MPALAVTDEKRLKKYVERALNLCGQLLITQRRSGKQKMKMLIINRISPQINNKTTKLYTKNAKVIRLINKTTC